MRLPYIFSVFLILYFVFTQGCMRMRISDLEAKKEFMAKGISITTSMVNISGISFHSVSNGSDSLPTLLFVHGSPGSWDAFKGFLKDSTLYSNFRLIAIDRPGFGYTAFGKPFNLIAQTEIISDFIKSVQNDKPLYLIGHSYGGPLVLQLACDTSLSIAGVLVLAGSVSPYLEKPEKWRIPFIWAPAFVPRALNVSNQELWWLKQDLYPLEKNLCNVKTKVSLVHGNLDRLVPYENMQFSFDRLTHAKTKDTLTIVGADHFIPWTHYPIVKEALLKLTSIN